MTRDQEERSVADSKQSLPLDAIVPLDREAAESGGSLIDRWADLAVCDLPPDVQRFALSNPKSWHSIAEALTKRNVVASACDEFVNTIQPILVARYGTRDATISLARAGLLTNEIPTLESLGRVWGISRERVRQLTRDIDPEAKAALVWRAPLRLAVDAWIALHRGTPFRIEDFADLETVHGHAVRLAFSAMDLQPVILDYSIWTATARECRAVQALLDAVPHMMEDARSFTEMKESAAAALPGIAAAIDLDATLRMLTGRLDFGPGLHGKFVFGYRALTHRVAAKVVTYLQRRAVPISATDLAQVIRIGLPPFEPFHRPLIEPEWLLDCTNRNPDLLQLQSGDTIALSHRLSHLHPAGTVGILHSIIVDHGEPMRTIELCDRAGQLGVSRNEVGVSIHGGRAACLFMLDRGIVGLVGRDEGADPSLFEATRPKGTHVRVGVEIGFDGQGRIAANVEVRRSIREQGFGLPWPFSIIYFSDRTSLTLDDERLTPVLRGNGDLDIPALEPGSQVRLRLAVTPNGHCLQIERNVKDNITLVRELGNGARVPIGLPAAQYQPGWINYVLANAGPTVGSLDSVVQLMPGTMSARRRLRALYALVALGQLEPRESGWVPRRDRRLPDKLAAAFAAVIEDPSLYPSLPPRDQAAVAWLVWATWLVPSVGWAEIRSNDLADVGVEDERIIPASRPTTNPRETALMRIVEAAHHGNDLRRNPGVTNGIDNTVAVVRRYLTALGFTAYNAVREINEIDEARAFSVHRASEGVASAIWILRPIGAGVSKSDVGRAKKLAADRGAPVAVVTDGLRLIAAESGTILDIDVQDIGRNQGEFDRLISLAVQPSLLREATDQEADS